MNQPTATTARPADVRPGDFVLAIAGEVIGSHLVEDVRTPVSTHAWGGGTRTLTMWFGAVMADITIDGDAAVTITREES